MATSSIQNGAVRQLEPHWNGGLIAASIIVSLLGAFTSTQMFCQARTSRYFSGILVWTILGSLTFGFCSIWSLHFIAMLACELDLPIGLNVPLTILSAALAVTFTFLALFSDLLRSRYLEYLKTQRKRRRTKRKQTRDDYVAPDEEGMQSTDALLGNYPDASMNSTGSRLLLTPDEASPPQRELRRQDSDGRTSLGPLEAHFHGVNGSAAQLPSPALSISPTRVLGPFASMANESSGDSVEDTDSIPRSSSEDDPSRRSSVTLASNSSDYSLPRFMSFKLAQSTTTEATNVVVGTAKGIYQGATLRNFCRGFIWSLAISSMHYSGIVALRIPDGYFTVQPFVVLLSASISWLVCTLASILIPRIEVNLAQQLLFSVVAATGVAAMHFTGMWATTFWSRAEPTHNRGYPPRLAIAVGTIAIGTCILANGLLAHTATMARNKLAEVVQTKRKLWAAIAQKENAEAAAAARSEFIASASHEIRTPLHQLQGYGDLLARTPLTEEGRLLLLAIQRATRSLSMITANVLDWSRLEKGEAHCRPSSLNLRQVCESILNILPNRDDDDFETELLVVVSPEVPNSIFLDETYLQRVLMNLLTNALKFTHSGYVLLMIESRDNVLNIRVQDSGSGISESFIPQLFEPFKQAQTLGAERGTGLGLAIIKQLLEKMQGTITVESNHFQVEGIGHQKSGSTFGIEIPVPTSSGSPRTIGSIGLGCSEVAVFAPSSGRFMEGFRMAWAAFGFDVILADADDKIPDSWKAIWTDVKFLSTRPKLLERLLRLQDQFVLVSYDSQLVLDKTVGSVPPSHIIPIKRPFVWHRIIESVAKAVRSGKSAVDRAVRFAPVVEVVEEGTPTMEKQNLQGFTILLVEDNKINQKLGVKMLKLLGYNVLLADDGEEAIEKVLAHDLEIDLILMDQSMPRKDGITATKQLREMEDTGGLTRRRPIVMATAVVGPDAQALCMSAGADAFLTKPLSLSQLERAMQRFLG
ncbi:uncharacterized protein A1O9_00597 [Exophiala aquamarina CBS 119918]|uniref:histidine kinase n=1 Tax=Exophiala aquamarina CBS 119918 TaxID=1182545 RepID=A0A072PR83_9EURO|nr:uncharacterized protein A1O9_00597 [Exophiala aquamarina CBS 119918]KEF62624.1 hypothetical protein A1O9_00597 [Exophiala aquamarina CBS 119918]